MRTILLIEDDREVAPKDLRLGLVEASANRIGSPVDNILTYCYHYDPQTNKHSLIVARVVQLGGLADGRAAGRIHAGHVPQRLHRQDDKRAATTGTDKGERIKEWTTSAQYSGSFSSSG